MNIPESRKICEAATGDKWIAQLRGECSGVVSKKEHELGGRPVTSYCNEADARFFVHAHEFFPLAIDELEANEREIADLRSMLSRLVEAVQVCDSNRGRFSCCEAHDCRCPKSRAASPEQWKGEWACECGSEELDAAYEAASAALAEKDGGGK